MCAAVLIVGAGPTGLTMGIELKRRGIAVRLIDKLQEPAPNSRALVIHPRSLETFERMGEVAGFLEAGAPMRGMALFGDGRIRARVPLNSLSDETAYPFVLGLEQSATEALLTERLKALGGGIERGVELKSLAERDAAVEVVLQNAVGPAESGTYAYVVGCDGAHSAVRRQLGIGFEGEAYPQSFYLADVTLSGPLPPETLVFCTSRRGTFAVFPLRKGTVHRLVIVNEEHFRPAGESPTLQEIQTFVADVTDGVLRPTAAEWLTRFRLHHRAAPRFSKGRVFLAGDAAHIHSPAGGQGMNTGIQDAFNLGWKMALVLKGRLPATVLETYDQERRPVATKLLLSTDRLFRMMANRSTLVRLGLRYVAPLFANTLLSDTRVQKRGTRFLTQLGIDYKGTTLHATLGASRPISARLHPGARLPDGELRTKGGVQRLHALLAKEDYVVLVFCLAVPAAEVLARAEAIRRQIVAEISGEPAFRIIRSVAPDAAACEDVDGRLAARLGITRPCLVLLRPDGYVGWCTSLD